MRDCLSQLAPLKTLAITGLLLVAGAIIAGTLRDVCWHQEQAHSVIEATGGTIALIVAAILLERSRYEQNTHLNSKPGRTLFQILLERSRYEQNTVRFIWIACALISIGVLDLTHAIVPVSNNGAFVHSLSTFIGGLLFSFVWLPNCLAERLPRRFILATATLLVMAALGLFLIFAKDLPMMCVQGQFTTIAKALNLAGGVCFLSAALWFARAFQKFRRKDDIVFANHCLILGVAGVMFVFSCFWHMNWWYWHGLRLVAFAVVLCFVLIIYRNVQESLLRARDQEIEVSKQKAAFVGNMSHELLTPLSGILGMNEILLAEDLGETQREYAQLVQESAQTLLYLIKNILVVSEAGRLTIENTPFNLLSMVDDAVAVVEPVIKNKKLRLIKQCAANIPVSLVGDPIRLRNVLVNLLENAAKFTHTGEICLSANVTSLDKKQIVCVRPVLSC